MCAPYWKFYSNIQRRNKEINKWKGKFWKAYTSATNNIIEGSKSTDSKRLGRAPTIR